MRTLVMSSILVLGLGLSACGHFRKGGCCGKTACEMDHKACGQACKESCQACKDGKECKDCKECELKK